MLEATYQSVAGTFSLTVTTGANISSVDITAGKIPTIGSPAQFTCTATFADGTTQDVTRTATWVSFNPAIATVSSTGLVTAVATGTAVVKATYLGASGTYTFRVTH